MTVSLIFVYYFSEPFALRERILQDGTDIRYQLVDLSYGLG